MPNLFLRHTICPLCERPPNHSHSYGFKSDVWALGCVLYEMATLKHPFEANSLSALAAKIMRGKYKMPSSAKYSSAFRYVPGGF